MCMVSALGQAGMNQIPFQNWTPDTFGQFKRIMDAIADLDKKLGTPHCEDPAKVAWMKEVEERLAKLEGKKKRGAK